MFSLPRAPAGGAAEMLAQELCSSLRDQLSPRGPASSLFVVRPDPCLLGTTEGECWRPISSPTDTLISCRMLSCFRNVYYPSGLDPCFSYSTVAPTSPHHCFTPPPTR